jgi:hypothetical protein
MNSPFGCDSRNTLYYDGQQVLAEFVHDPEALPPTPVQTLVRYFVDGPVYIDEHVLMHDVASGEDYYYLPRELHTVAGVVDELAFFINANGHVHYTLLDANNNVMCVARAAGVLGLDGADQPTQRLALQQHLEEAAQRLLGLRVRLVDAPNAVVVGVRRARIALRRVGWSARSDRLLRENSRRALVSTGRLDASSAIPAAQDQFFGMHSRSGLL